MSTTWQIVAKYFLGEGEEENWKKDKTQKQFISFNFSIVGSIVTEMLQQFRTWGAAVFFSLAHSIDSVSALFSTRAWYGKL